MLSMATTQFADWMAVHHRSYASPAEHAMREANFEASVRRVAASARANPHARFALDHTADWSAEELSGGGALQIPHDAAVQPPFSDAAVARAVGPIDWVERGAVTTPTSQGRCGTCAQFSAVADFALRAFFVALVALCFLLAHAGLLPPPAYPDVTRR